MNQKAITKAAINTVILLLVVAMCAVCYYCGHEQGYTDAQQDLNIKYFEEVL